MKALILSTEFPPGPGGIGNHTQQLATELTARGWAITVVAPQDYATPDEALEFRNLQPYRVVTPQMQHGPSRRLDRFRHSLTAVWRTRPHVVVASGAGAVLLARVLCGKRRPWLAVGHGTEFGEQRGARKLLLKLAYSQAPAVICVSEYTRERMFEFGALPSHTEVVHNGADATLPDLAPPDSRTMASLVPGLPEGPVILTVGNVTDRKGQEVVVRALPHILAEVPNAQYVAAGLPTKGAELRALARELGVADHVHLTGAIPKADLALAYRSADLLAMTSRHTTSGDFEGFGIAAMEAALFGKPAVVSDSGGLPEAVVDGVTGLVVAENDPRATAEAIVRVLKDPALGESLGAAGKARANREFTWSAVGERYDHVMRSIGGLDPAPAPKRPRKLVFISDTPHFRQDGELVGWAATVNEIDVLATLFEEVVHITPLYSGTAESSSAAYKAPNVRLRFVQQAGGDRVLEKATILLAVRGWSKAIREELTDDCAVHVRGPSSVALHALVWFLLHPKWKVHWFKYAGNWRPDIHDALSYRIHRFMLRHFHASPITVNGQWPNQRPNVHTFINPTFTDAQLAAARSLGAGKKLEDPVRLLFVGRLHSTKGPDRALETAARLHELGYNVTLDMVGDGPLAADLATEAERRGIADRVNLVGWLGRDELAPYYARAHLLLLPTEWEGFPKVVSEAMAYGTVPIAGAVSSIPQMLRSMQLGRAVPSHDVEGFVAASRWYLDHPDVWQEESDRAVEAAGRFSFKRYLGDVINLFDVEWGIHLSPRPSDEAESVTAGQQ